MTFTLDAFRNLEMSIFGMIAAGNVFTPALSHQQFFSRTSISVGFRGRERRQSEPKKGVTTHMNECGTRSQPTQYVCRFTWTILVLLCRGSQQKNVLSYPIRSSSLPRT